MASYKAIINSSDYIVHFNKNHDPTNGQFAPGDGDGDGQTEYQDIRRVKKYQNQDGSLNEKGKQRLLQEYSKQRQKAIKKNQSTADVKVEVDPRKWRRQDIGKGFGNAAKALGFIVTGFLHLKTSGKYDTSVLPDDIYVGYEEDAVKTWLDKSGIYYEYLDEGIKITQSDLDRIREMKK